VINKKECIRKRRFKTYGLNESGKNIGTRLVVLVLNCKGIFEENIHD
jgi:hypothetical protein